MDNYKSKLLKGSSYSLLSSFFLRGLRVIKSLIIARYLGPENFGMYSILTSLSGFGIAVADFGNSFSMVKLIGKYKSENKSEVSRIVSSIVWNVLAITFMVTLIFIGSSKYISTTIYNEPRLQFYIILIGLFLFIPAILTINRSILQSFHKIKEIAGLDTINSIMALIIFYILVREYNLTGAIASAIVSNFIALSLTLLLVTRKVFESEKIKLFGKVDMTILKESLKTSTPNISQTLIDVSAPLISGSILIYLLDFENLGYYHVASYFTWIVLSIPLAIATAYYPIINELYSKKSPKYSTYIVKSQKTVCFISFPVALSLGLFSNYLISGIYGDEYLLATNVAFWRSVSAFFASFGTLLGFTYYVHTQGFKLVKIRLLWLLTYIISSYLLILEYGVLGIGLAHFIAYVIQSFLLIIMLPTEINIKKIHTSILIIISLCLVCISYSIWMLSEKSILLSSSLILLAISLEYLFLTHSEKSSIKNGFKYILKMCKQLGIKEN